MDLWTLVRTVVRQWRVVAPVLVATVAAIALLVVTTPDVHQTSASIILVPLVPDAAAASSLPSAQGDTAAESPDLSAQALAAVVSSDSSVTALQAQGATAGFTVTKDASGPLLRVQAEGDDPEVVLGTARAVIDRIVTELDTRQAESGVAEGERLRADVLAVPEGSRPGSGSGAYVAAGSVLLVNADSRAPSIDSNPYARLAESTSPVLSGLAQGQDFQRIVATSGLADADFQIDPDPRAAVIYLTATSPDEGTAERIANTLIGAFREELSARQTALGLPQDIWFTFTVLAPPTTEQLPPDLLRSLVAIAGVGGLIALGAAVLAENWRARAAGPEADAEPSEESSAPQRPSPPRPIRTASGAAPGAGPLGARGRGTATGGRVRSVVGDEAWMPAERE